jgi:hypothetical protein
VSLLGIQLRAEEILQLDRRIMAWHECLILISQPGVGRATA